MPDPITISKNRPKVLRLFLRLIKAIFYLTVIIMLAYLAVVLDQGYSNLQKQNTDLSNQVANLQAKQTEFEAQVLPKLGINAVEATPNPTKPNAGDRRLGETSSRYTLMVYVDFECPFCKQAHPIEKEFYQQNQSELSLVLRHFPLESIHPTALKKSEIAECAFIQKGNEGFFEAVDAIFSTENIVTVPTKQLADILKLNDTKLGTCLNNQEALAAVKAQQKEGLDANIPGTPTMFLHDSKTERIELLENIGSLRDLQNSFDNFKTKE